MLTNADRFPPFEPRSSLPCNRLPASIAVVPRFARPGGSLAAIVRPRGRQLAAVAGAGGQRREPRNPSAHRLDQASGIVWQCPLPKWGNSTPAIWGNAIFVTTQVDDEKLLLLKINKKSGQIEWTRQVGAEAVRTQPSQGKPASSGGTSVFHESHNLASPSPVTDGQLVVVHFGNGDLAAYDFDGNQLWHRNLQKDYGDYTIWWGHANSPVLYENLVISICMQDSCADLPGKPSPSYVVAHDMRTGRRAMEGHANDAGQGRTLRFLHHAAVVEHTAAGRSWSSWAGRCSTPTIRPPASGCGICPS